MKILVDWGSSNFRAFLVDGDAVIDHAHASDGILKLYSAANANRDDAFFSHFLVEKTGHWLAAHPDAQVILCGAVGSREGWVNTGYVEAPAGFAEIAARLYKVQDNHKGELAGREIFIVPGVAQEKDGRHDIMRSEEVKSLGAARRLGLRDALLCVPGTHCKWVKIRQEKIVDFHTVLTGEMFALLSGHGSLAPLFRAENNSESGEEASFDEGIELAQLDHGILSNIWQVRARKLHAQHPPQNLTAFLSGILIGHELRHADQLYDGPREVILLADKDKRREFYRQALLRRGWTIPAEIDSETAVCIGLLSLLEI